MELGADTYIYAPASGVNRFHDPLPWYGVFHIATAAILPPEQEETELLSVKLSSRVINRTCTYTTYRPVRARSHGNLGLHTNCLATHTLGLQAPSHDTRDEHMIPLSQQVGGETRRRPRAGLPQGIEQATALPPSRPGSEPNDRPAVPSCHRDIVLLCHCYIRRREMLLLPMVLVGVMCGFGVSYLSPLSGADAIT
ncbi:hypothetical protein BDY21DRAFT_33827 [Lineolata rhizophorae]|uniref:Uncharacterized protein n=1 Tax=Lineolata rhizophorae TaxID=578093 RepID=A0A6A6NZD9_9PEZI|nr:hypothetical protein BDY21DRAFT_33827 [Lineolata rhizophorae]